jgi:chitodextrinase
VDLTWDASSDANGVEAYDIYRGGNLVDSVDGATLQYSDTTVGPNTQYSYVVKARDPSDNTSDPSNTATVTTPALDTQNPQPPTNLDATAVSAGRVDLTWDAGSDDVGVTAYDVYRGGSLLASVDGATLAYSDQTVTAGTQYSYTVRSRCGASFVGRQQRRDVTAVRRRGLPGRLRERLAVDVVDGGRARGEPRVTAPSGGQWVARETANGGGSTYAFKSISPTVTDVYARFRFKVLSRTGSVDLMRFRNNSGGASSPARRRGHRKLSTRNAVSGTAIKSNAVINTGQWYTVEVHGWSEARAPRRYGSTGPSCRSSAPQDWARPTSDSSCWADRDHGTYDVAFDDVIVSKNLI